MKRILASILITSLSLGASAGDMYVYKDKGGQVQLTNVNPSNNFDKFTKKVDVTYYKDSEKYGNPSSPNVSGEKEMGYAEKAYYALSGHAPIVKEKPQEMYIDDDGHVRLTKTESGELSASDKMLMKWRAESAEREAAAKKLAKKPNAAIGMSKSQVRNKTNWGEPKYINTTTNKYGTHEQWVYDDYQYLYFDNGKLTTIQQ